MIRLTPEVHVYRPYGLTPQCTPRVEFVKEKEAPFCSRAILRRWGPLCPCGQGDNVTLLISGGADVSATNAMSRSALHIAAHEGGTGSAEQLLVAGADPDAEDDMGRTPMHWARTMNHTALVTLLKPYGAEK